MSDLIDERKRQRALQELERRRAPDASQNLAKGTLDQDVMKVKGSIPEPNLSEPVARIKGTTDHIDTAGKTSISGGDFELRQNLRATMRDAYKRGDRGMMEKLTDVAKKVGKNASKGLKTIPVLGALAGLAMNPDDAAASIPGLDAAEGVGMGAEAENQMLAETDAKLDYEKSDAKKDRLAALAKLLK